MFFRRHILFGLFICFGNGAVVTSSGCFDGNNTNFYGYTEDQFVAFMTDPKCYDKYKIPSSSLTVDVHVSLTHLEASQSQLTAYMKMKFSYTDPELTYENVNSSLTVVKGEQSLKDLIWTPQVFTDDQIGITVKDFQEKDVFISIYPNGTVIYTFKLIVTFVCSFNLKKFPFDSQNCTLRLSDWSYDSNSLTWSIPKSLDYNFDHFSEYILHTADLSITNNSGPYDLDTISGSQYSELTISLEFYRDVGYYLLDFFVPSYLLVCTAWVTFWLQADAGPPRATLGASTVIAFVTLHLGVAKDIPKVSYIKASDIWFLGISCFIFFSLAEFAFVNVIWRRKKQVELKKRNNKHILKGAVMPSVARKDLRKHVSTPTLWTTSSENLNNADNSNGSYRSNIDLVTNGMENHQSTINIPDNHQSTWETMTPREVAIWVDRKARIVFPLVFIIFNILYWTFVYVL